MAGTDLLQQIDELVPGQPLEHGEVRQLWGVRPMGKSHGSGHRSSGVEEGRRPPLREGRQQPGVSAGPRSFRPGHGSKEPPKGPSLLRANEWPPLAQTAAASEDPRPDQQPRDRPAPPRSTPPVTRIPVYLHPQISRREGKTPPPARERSDFLDLPEVPCARPALSLPGRGRRAGRDIRKREAKGQRSSLLPGQREVFPSSLIFKGTPNSPRSLKRGLGTFARFQNFVKWAKATPGPEGTDPWGSWLSVKSTPQI